ncbi:hypothetical protein AX16_007124 [Volvariella volvacea WC 439]|nr:hypothetical protein AX16_007124 [Volvariella volvacea WC 439]
MKAVRYYAPQDIRVEDIPEPVLKPGQVKVKIAWGGICGSDLHAYIKPSPPYPHWQGHNDPHPVTGESAPVTLGHEFAGTIVELGPDVDPSKWSVGVNVAIPCARGETTMCPKINFIGIGGWGGGLSEFIGVDTRFLHILPPHVPLEVGACIEPLAVAWYAVKKSGFKPGQSALINGAGPVGLFILKVLRALSPSSTVIVSEPALLRRKLALEHGATLVLDPTAPGVDVIAQIREASGGEGTDVVLEAAGLQKSWDVSMMAVRSRGTIVIVALWENQVKMDLNLIVGREVIVTGVLAYDHVHAEVIEAVASGKITGIESLITRKIALEDAVTKGFEALLHEKDSQGEYSLQQKQG